MGGALKRTSQNDVINRFQQLSEQWKRVVDNVNKNGDFSLIKNQVPSLSGLQAIKSINKDVQKLEKKIQKKPLDKRIARQAHKLIAALENTLLNIVNESKSSSDEENLTKIKEKLNGWGTNFSENLESYIARKNVSSWVSFVDQVRKGEKKVPFSITRNYETLAHQVFSDKMSALKKELMDEKLKDESLPFDPGKFDKEIASLSPVLEEFIQEVHHNKNYGSRRMKVICMDLLIDDLSQVVRSKFSPQKPPAEKNVKPKLSIVKIDGKVVYRLQKAASPIKNLTLRGGGGKGLGYVGTIQEFSRQGRLESLDAVSGSSAGGIAAVALALGTPPNELGDFCNQIQSGIGRKVSKDALKRMPFLKDRFKGISLLGSAAGIISAVDEASVKAAGKFLEKQEVQDAIRRSVQLPENHPHHLSPEEGTRLNYLLMRHLERKPAESESDLLTFRDMELLRKVEDVMGVKKHQFLDVTLTAWDGTDQKELYLNAKNFPGMSLADAVRITMALPGAFKRVDLDISRFRKDQPKTETVGANMGDTSSLSALEDPVKNEISEKEESESLKAAEVNSKSGKHKLFDGGLGSNSPVEVFIDTDQNYKKLYEAKAKELSEKIRNEKDPGRRKKLEKERHDLGINFSKEDLEYQRSQQETFNLVFDNGGKGFSNESSRYRIKENIFVRIFFTIMGAMKNHKTMIHLREKEDQKLDEVANTFVVGHGDFGTMSMTPKEEEKRAADTMSALMAAEWGRQHDEQGIFLETDSLPALLQQLSPEELEDMEWGYPFDAPSDNEEYISRFKKEDIDEALKNEDLPVSLRQRLEQISQQLPGAE